MVSEAVRKHQTIYHCEFCAFGYRDLKTAESCEQFCDSHGYSSPEILRKAVYSPVDPVLTAA